ncbi:hypothetical protein QUB56_10005 [Microcoleus sp. AR_TQ3_B6]|uniref:hypothetical protein n=1 Tax=Microcoleus sp. AR_TQ3_B6 TaxID=3055284 RepID=UPI002FD2ADB2
MRSPITTQRVRINPSDALAYYDRGMVRVRLGEFPGASPITANFYELFLTKASAYQNRGVARRDSGDKSGAIQDFQRAPDLYQQRGDKNSYEKAIYILMRLQ